MLIRCWPAGEVAITSGTSAVWRQTDYREHAPNPTRMTRCRFSFCLPGSKVLFHRQSVSINIGRVQHRY